MKKILLLCVFLLVFGMVGIASAIPTTWVDEIDFDPDELVPPTLSYYHDISDNGFGEGDTITGFELEVAIYDDNEGTTEEVYKIVKWNWIFPVWDWVEVEVPDGGETAYVYYGLEADSYSFGNSSEIYTGDLLSVAKLDIYDDGTLNVWIANNFLLFGYGDFLVGSSKLTVYGDNGDTASVPEPASMLLLGTGLVGLAAFGRKRFFK